MMRSGGNRCKVANDDSDNDDDNRQDDDSKKQQSTSKHKGMAATGMGQWLVIAKICCGGIAYPPPPLR